MRIALLIGVAFEGVTREPPTESLGGLGVGCRFIEQEIGHASSCSSPVNFVCGQVWVAARPQRSMPQNGTRQHLFA